MKKSFFDTIPGVVRLNSRVAIYVPSTTDTDHPTDNRQQVEEVAAKLSAMFGGATATEVRRTRGRGPHHRLQQRRSGGHRAPRRRDRRYLSEDQARNETRGRQP